MTETELYHHGVKGMKWGVRKDTSGSASSIDRRVRKLNRLNSRMEKNLAVSRHLNEYYDSAKKSNNLLKRATSMSQFADRKIVNRRYERTKKKVDNMLADMTKDGVTLETMRKRKTGLISGGQWNFISSWSGVDYTLGTERGRSAVQNIMVDNGARAHQQFVNQQFQQQAVMEANRTASLGLSGGTNPFMFG